MASNLPSFCNNDFAKSSKTCMSLHLDMSLDADKANNPLGQPNK